MKTNLLFTKLFCVASIMLLVSNNGNTQTTSNELIFQNSSLYSGTAGNDGAVYKFPAVNNDLDALVTITGRSSSLVQLSSIDIPGNGFPNAFQPQIRFNNGNVSGTQSWWMEFEIKFVNLNTMIPGIINNFSVTGLDIDGNNDKLREWQAYYGITNYTLESNTQLITSNITGILSLPLLSGKKFTGCINDYGGIDTSATEIMTTLNYTGQNVIYLRMGGETTGSTGNANRMYSTWFKSFTYNAPITLPIKLASFSATLNNKTVNVKWTTVMEENVSHFTIERSFDGINFTDIATVFAYGNSNETRNYAYPDDISSVQSNMIFYRLRSNDIDGKTQYSDVRIIKLSNKNVNTVSITTYPNPAINKVNVTIPNNWQNKKVIFEVFSANGQVQKRAENTNSSQTETINISNLAPGFYIVRVSCNGEAAQQKIIKQ